MCERLTRNAMKLADIESNPQEKDPKSDEYKEALRISRYAKEHGWQVEDVQYCMYSGVWPFNPDEYAPYTEVEKYITDATGWRNRHRFEVMVSKQSGFPTGRSVQYFDCVRCWRSDGQEGCVCEDGGTFLPADWRCPRIDIMSNLGREIFVGG